MAVNVNISGVNTISFPTGVSSASVSGGTATVNLTGGGGPGGGWTPATTTQTTAYAAVASDVVLCNTSGGGFTVTLPAAASNANAIIIVKKISSDANVVTVARSSTDTIDSQTSQSISGQWTAIMLLSDGVSSWSII